MQGPLRFLATDHRDPERRRRRQRRHVRGRGVDAAGGRWLTRVLLRAGRVRWRREGGPRRVLRRRDPVRPHAPGTVPRTSRRRRGRSTRSRTRWRCRWTRGSNSGTTSGSPWRTPGRPARRSASTSSRRGSDPSIRTARDAVEGGAVTPRTSRRSRRGHRGGSVPSAVPLASVYRVRRVRCEIPAQTTAPA